MLECSLARSQSWENFAEGGLFIAFLSNDGRKSQSLVDRVVRLLAIDFGLLRWCVVEEWLFSYRWKLEEVSEHEEAVPTEPVVFP